MRRGVLVVHSVWISQLSTGGRSQTARDRVCVAILFGSLFSLSLVLAGVHFVENLPRERLAPVALEYVRAQGRAHAAAAKVRKGLDRPHTRDGCYLSRSSLGRPILMRCKYCPLDSSTDPCTRRLWPLSSCTRPILMRRDYLSARQVRDLEGLDPALRDEVAEILERGGARTTLGL